MELVRIATLAAMLAGASIGLAGPASAEPLEGPYTATVTGGNAVSIGQKMPWTFEWCGSDCVHRTTIGGPAVDFHLQGNTWTASWGNGITETIDASSLTATTKQPDGTITWQLSRP